MKNILLDTHVLIWLAAGVKVGPKTLELIQKSDTVYVSTMSILEIRIKHATGKLPEPKAFIESIEAMNFSILDFSHEQAGQFEIHDQSNKDPFDNTLVSIAFCESLPFVTADQHILSIHKPNLALIDART